jgi:hypothetical protein
VTIDILCLEVYALVWLDLYAICCKKEEEEEEES